VLAGGLKQLPAPVGPQPVMALAEQDGVPEVGLAAVCPVHQVMPASGLKAPAYALPVRATGRRRRQPPSALEKARRFALRVWYLYPKPFRQFYKFNTLVTLYVVGTLVAVLVIALLVQLVFRIG